MTDNVTSAPSVGLSAITQEDKFQHKRRKQEEEKLISAKICVSIAC